MVENVAPKQVWDALASHPEAKLVDVRTDIEWGQIGVPDLSSAAKSPILLSWQVAPAMQVNPNFVNELQAAGVMPEDHVYFLCRSGVRSMASAQAAQAAGFRHVYNIADGFEGPPNGQGTRGQVAGWQADGLPWNRDEG